jgi:hypothetical protein
MLIKIALVVWKECSRLYELRSSMTRGFFGCSVAFVVSVVFHGAVMRRCRADSVEVHAGL